MNEPWRMTSPCETAWTERVERSADLRIADLAKVRVGIKTTADSIFIRDDWESLADAYRPEDELLRPILTHFDAERWVANKPPSALLRVLYTHELTNGKRRTIDFPRYPRAWAYLQKHRERLEGRTFVIEAGRRTGMRSGCPRILGHGHSRNWHSRTSASSPGSFSITRAL